MKIAINEMFGPTLQGEGKYIGQPCLFIRTNGCNLRCQWKNLDGTITKCDTPYTSWNVENKPLMEVDEVVDWVKERKIQYPFINKLVITGGEPMLQKGLEELIYKVKNKFFMHVTIETNGTIFKRTSADLISLSPKLISSTPEIGTPEALIHIKNRKYNCLDEFKSYYRDIQYKFVYNSKDDIEDIKKNFLYLFNIPNNKVWLMPQGITIKQLKEKSKELFDICSEQGFNYAPRLHIDVYDDKRGI